MNSSNSGDNNFNPSFISSSTCINKNGPQKIDVTDLVSQKAEQIVLDFGDKRAVLRGVSLLSIESTAFGLDGSSLKAMIAVDSAEFYPLNPRQNMTDREYFNSLFEEKDDV